jgi:hypothetical protein
MIEFIYIYSNVCMLTVSLLEKNVNNREESSISI